MKLNIPEWRKMTDVERVKSMEFYIAKVMKKIAKNRGDKGRGEND